MISGGPRNGPLRGRLHPKLAKQAYSHHNQKRTSVRRKITSPSSMSFFCSRAFSASSTELFRCGAMGFEPTASAALGAVIDLSKPPKLYCE